MEYEPSSWSETRGGSKSWASGLNAMTRIMGFSFFASMLGNSADSLASNSVKLFILGTLVEIGRRFFQWAYERFNIFLLTFETPEFSVTAQFDEGDPIYERITLFLTEKKIWKRSRHFHVTTTSSKRKWGIELAAPGKKKQDQADYVPTFEVPQLFKWQGYWAEIKRTNTNHDVYSEIGEHMGTAKILYLTIYTRDMSALASFVEDAKALYVTASRLRVTVHTSDQNTFGPSSPWVNTKSKSRRPLNTIVLQSGVIQALLEDAQEFIAMEDWYTEAGIPYRRGYLLHGPPGTGKTSTIYALAGELGLEIYSLSLASSFVDDAFLQRAVSAIPKSAIFVLEDIDCAFPSREDEEDETEEVQYFPGRGMGMGRRRGGRQVSNVTLSGLLNVLDGIGSEEGKLFFATTNYIDRLDAALIRPGRIDKKVEYHLSTKDQAESLFKRFYPHTLVESIQSETRALSEKSPSISDNVQDIISLASEFASSLPENEFSTAELQGYLLSCKKEPKRAVAEFNAWIEEKRAEKEKKRIREEERKEKKLARERQLMSMSMPGGMAPPSAPPAPVNNVDGSTIPLSTGSANNPPQPLTNGLSCVTCSQCLAHPNQVQAATVDVTV